MHRIKYPTQKQLLKAFSYDPRTGFVGHRLTHGRAVAGTRAGNVSTLGYRRVGYGGFVYFEHVIIWIIMTGTQPKSDIDHVDRNKSNNAWNNLRIGTRQQNSANARSRRGSVGLKGVARHGARYRAQIGVGYKSVHLGVFATPEMAHAAYCAAAKKHFGAFARFK